MLPVSPCSVGFSLCVILVCRNPSLYPIESLSKSSLLSLMYVVSEGLVLQDVECAGYNQRHKKFFCALVVAHADYLYTKHFTGM